MVATFIIRHSKFHNLWNNFSPNEHSVPFFHGDCLKQGTHVSVVTVLLQSERSFAYYLKSIILAYLNRTGCKELSRQLKASSFFSQDWELTFSPLPDWPFFFFFLLTSCSIPYRNAAAIYWNTSHCSWITFIINPTGEMHNFICHMWKLLRYFVQKKCLQLFAWLTKPDCVCLLRNKAEFS